MKRVSVLLLTLSRDHTVTVSTATGFNKPVAVETSLRPDAAGEEEKLNVETLKYEKQVDYKFI